MTLLELILILVLQFKGISGAFIYLYYRPGDEAILPCDNVSSSDGDCSTVEWLYNRNTSQTSIVVKKGNVVKNSARAARMSLDTSCSVVINNIAAVDVGRYTCRLSERDINVHLSILTILPSPPDADPNRDGKVTLECSLLRYSVLPPCQPDSIRWLDETGSVVHGDGDGYEFIGQTDCVSVLTVKRQSGQNRRYTCQWLNSKNEVRIEVDYTPVFTEVTSDDQPDESNTDPSLDQTYIITGAVVGVVVLVVIVITAVFIKFRKRHTATEDFPKTANPPDRQEPQDEPDGSLTYVTVNHANQKTTSKKKVKEEGVTYSTVKTPVTTDAGDDPGKIYSYVNE